MNWAKKKSIQFMTFRFRRFYKIDVNALRLVMNKSKKNLFDKLV